MCDFDLSQALEGSSDEMGSESSCFNMTHNVEEEIVSLAEGLDLVVSCNRKTMKRVANLLVVINRMKKPFTHCGEKLCDDELCSVILDSVVKETIIKRTENFSTKGTNHPFYRGSCMQMCTLCDTSQKHIVHRSGEMKLQAITLKGGHSEHKVNFKLSSYMTPSVSQSVQTVALSMINTNLNISCSMKDGTAVLNLEECCDKDLQTISDDRDRFLFYKRTTGLSYTTFESVRCPGWFISTSYDAEKQPVEMCKVDAFRRVTNFKIN